MTKSSRSMCNVLALLLIVLFVSVSVVALPTRVSLPLDGNESVISLDGLPGESVVSKLAKAKIQMKNPISKYTNALV